MKLRSDGVYLSELDGRSVLLDTRTSEYLMVNKAGSILLDVLHDDVSLADLVQALVTHFELEPGRAEADAETFLDALRSRSMLVP